MGRGRESGIEKACVAYAAKRGLRAYKLKEIGRRGWPDRTIFLDSGAPVFVEFKSPKTGRLSSDQEKRRDELQSRGTWWVIEDFDTFKDKLDHILWAENLNKELF